MASVFELEAMIMCRDKILAKLFDLTLGPAAGKEYTKAIESADTLIKQATTEMEMGG